MWKAILFGAFALILGACTTTPQMEDLRQTPYAGNSPLIAQLRAAAPYARKDITIAVGDCQDKTGQFKDDDQLRYSRRVTQACLDFLTHILQTAGFVVVDRSPYNLELLANEHQLANTFTKKTDESGNEVLVNTGLIQRNRPQGGITGASFVWSAAIASYSPAIHSSGGGVEVLGAGVNYREETARVSVITRITKMDSVVLDSEQVATEVIGRKAGFSLLRIVSLLGGDTFFSAELGAALQMPVDMAFEDALIANVVGILNRNKERFYAAGFEGSVTFEPLSSSASHYGLRDPYAGS